MQCLLNVTKLIKSHQTAEIFVSVGLMYMLKVINTFLTCIYTSQLNITIELSKSVVQFRLRSRNISAAYILAKTNVKGDSFSGNISMPVWAWRGAAACHFCCLFTLLCRGGRKKVSETEFGEESWGRFWHYRLCFLQGELEENFKAQPAKCREPVCCFSFIPHMVTHTCRYTRRLKVSHLSTRCFVALLVSAELSTFESKHALGFSHTVTKAKTQSRLSASACRGGAQYLQPVTRTKSSHFAEKCSKPWQHKVTYSVQRD